MKVMRSLNDPTNASIFVDGFRTYYNYIRPHQGLDGMTPAQMANIPINLDGNRWLKMIELANHSKSAVMQQAGGKLAKCRQRNRSTGMENPADRDTAAQSFVILKEGGETYSPDEIKAWLISRAGWRATHAHEVAEVAAEVLLGKKSGNGIPAWPGNALQTWRARAAQQ